VEWHVELKHAGEMKFWLWFWIDLLEPGFTIATENELLWFWWQ
jgi:hypothetical protein